MYYEEFECNVRVVFDVVCWLGVCFVGSFRFYVLEVLVIVIVVFWWVVFFVDEFYEVGIMVMVLGFYGVLSWMFVGIINIFLDIKGIFVFLSVGECRVLNFEMELSLFFLLVWGFGIEVGMICLLISSFDVYVDVLFYVLCIEVVIDVVFVVFEILEFCGVVD